jgi:hypothetical protein
MRHALGTGVAVVLLGATFACIGVFDVFNRSTAKLPGGYCLELEREFSHYRIQDCSGKRSIVEGVGVLEGTVESIGWNDRSIVAWRSSCCSAGDGFMIIDVVSDRIEGPLSREALDVRLKADAHLAGIKILAASDVLK